MGSPDFGTNFRIEASRENELVTAALKLILENEDKDENQPFETIGTVRRHVKAYDIGNGTCARLHFSMGMTTAERDFQNHLALIKDGFPVPELRSGIYSNGRQSAFAVSVIDGVDRVESRSPGTIKSDSKQIIDIMRLAMLKGWKPIDWAASGNILREDSTGRLVVVDVTDWIKISTLNQVEQISSLNYIKSIIEEHEAVVSVN